MKLKNKCFIFYIILYFSFYTNLFGIEKHHIAKKYFDNAKIYIKNYDYEKAYLLLLKALDYDSNNPLYNNEIAMIYDLYENYDMAIEHYKKAIELKNYNYSQALFNLAYLLKKNKDYKNSLKYFKILDKKYNDKFAKSEINEIKKILRINR